MTCQEKKKLLGVMCEYAMPARKRPSRTFQNYFFLELFSKLYKIFFPFNPKEK